jgi:gamma-glutamyl phosphate reductase
MNVKNKMIVKVLEEINIKIKIMEINLKNIKKHKEFKMENRHKDRITITKHRFPVII